MQRISELSRDTKETQIKAKLNLDGSGKRAISTGIGYLDHMLEAWALHGSFDLDLDCKGDLEVCPHHSIEDIAIVLGKVFRQCLGDRLGLIRFGDSLLPMDEALTRTVVDISGRPFHVYKGQLNTEKVGEYPTEMVKHFFYSFTINAEITLHQEVLYGENDHHIVESLYKGLSRSLKKAVAINPTGMENSTKGKI